MENLEIGFKMMCSISLFFDLLFKEIKESLEEIEKIGLDNTLIK